MDAKAEESVEVKAEAPIEAMAKRILRAAPDRYADLADAQEEVLALLEAAGG